MKSNKLLTNLIICNSYPTKINPTAQTFIKNIKEQLEYRGINSYVYYNKIFDIWPNATNYKSIPANIIKYTIFILGLIPLCFKLHQFKTINPHGIIISGFIGAIFKKLLKKRLLTHIHGGDVNLYASKGTVYKILFDFTLKQSDVVIANSNDIRDKLIKTYSIQKKIKKVYPGVNNEIFYKYDPDKKIIVKKTYSIPINKIVLLFIGNAIKRKGLDLFFYAIDKLSNEEIIKIHVVICSEGPELLKIKNEIIKRPQLKKIFTFIKKINQKKLPEIYALGDIFVFPSIEEPLGLVGIEALACGLPVIASKVGGIEDYLIDGYNGIFFESKDIYQLSEIISRLINNPSFINELKLNTGNNLEQFFSDYTSLQLKNIFSNK